MKLPEPNEHGHYRFADGSAIWRAESVRDRWFARWADGRHLKGDNDQTYFFKSPEEAAQALADGGEGPALEVVDGDEYFYLVGSPYFHLSMTHALQERFEDVGIIVDNYGTLDEAKGKAAAFIHAAYHAIFGEDSPPPKRSASENGSDELAGRVVMSHQVMRQSPGKVRGIVIDYEGPSGGVADAIAAALAAIPPGSSTEDTTDGRD